MIRLHRGSHAARLLAAYGEATLGLLDEEAAWKANIPPRSNWWSRCSELRASGLIEPTVLLAGNLYKKESSMGENAQVCNITDAGRKTLNEIENKEPV